MFVAEERGPKQKNMESSSHGRRRCEIDDYEAGEEQYLHNL